MFSTYIIYNTILFFVCLFGYFVKVSANKFSEYASRTILFLSIILPASIRKGIGTDYWSYVSLYELYRKDGDEHEIGFQFIGKVLNYWGFEAQMFIAMLVILAFISVCYLVPKKSFYPFIVIYFLTIFPSCMSTSRQSVAIGLVVCGIFMLYEKKGRLKYLLCVALAFLMHYSSVLYFPFVFLKNIRLSKTSIWVLIGIVAVLSSGTYLIEAIFNSQLFLDSPYGVYAFNEYNRETSVGSGLGVTANLIIPVLFLLLSQKVSKKEQHVGFYVILSLCYIFTYLLALKIHIFGRLLGSFVFVPALLISPVVQTLIPAYRKFVLLLFFMLYIILFEKTIAVSQISLGNGLGISPYTTIFD